MEVVSKSCQDWFLHPILVHSIIEKKENTGSQIGHTKKIIFKDIIWAVGIIKWVVEKILKWTLTYEH